MASLLLLSNSTLPGEPYFGWALPHLRAWLGAAPRQIFFVPYAGVTIEADAYTARVRAALAPMGHAVAGAHEGDMRAALEEADVIAVGGGNTFRLLEQLHVTGLLAAIRERVAAGTPYVGWSAGANVACPTIGTTNDMPIVAPPSLAALSLVPFQVNAHYTEARLPGHGGESRAERLAEYLELNRGTTVVALPEGSGLEVTGGEMRLVGSHAALVLRHGQAHEELAPGWRGPMALR